MKKEGIRLLIIDSLTQLYGLNEAKSIAEYYLDAQAAQDKTIEEKQFKLDLEKLKNGIPVQYVSGLSFFYGYEFLLNTDVLIPRAETEELVYWAVSDFKKVPDLKILDIGSGSGCILISMLLELEKAKGEAWDISEKALQCIKRNLNKYDLAAKVIEKDVLLLDTTETQNKFDIIMCNPPYILNEEVNRMGENVVSNEPHLALFVQGNDPLIFYKTIIDSLNLMLNPTGVAYFETSDLYHEEFEEYLQMKEVNYEFRKDMQEKWRMVKVFS